MVGKPPQTTILGYWSMKGADSSNNTISCYFSIVTTQNQN